MSYDPDADSNYAHGAYVTAMERAGEAIGQMQTGSRSSLMWCPRCNENNCLTIVNESSVVTGYYCRQCGADIGVNEI